MEKMHPQKIHQALATLADAELKLILAGQSNYSRAGALLAIRQTLEKRIYDLGEVLDDPYSMKALDEISIEITEKLERELPQDGWKDPNAKSEDSLTLRQKSSRFRYQQQTIWGRKGYR